MNKNKHDETYTGTYLRVVADPLGSAERPVARVQRAVRLRGARSARLGLGRPASRLLGRARALGSARAAGRAPVARYDHIRV